MTVRCAHPGCPIPDVAPPHHHQSTADIYAAASMAMADSPPRIRRIGTPPELALPYRGPDPGHALDALRYAGMVAYGALKPPGWRCGFLFRGGSFWIGAHWSPRNRRLCVNLLPFVTIWVAWPGGKTPDEE